MFCVRRVFSRTLSNYRVTRLNKSLIISYFAIITCLHPSIKKCQIRKEFLVFNNKVGKKRMKQNREDSRRGKGDHRCRRGPAIRHAIKGKEVSRPHLWTGLSVSRFCQTPTNWHLPGFLPTFSIANQACPASTN